MQYSKYHNCLRLPITNDEMQDIRINDLAEHCIKYGFDNVMLMINQEEFNLGHIPLDKARPWIAVIKKAAERLRENGISVSVNNWIEIGHADRGRTLAPGQNFRLMTDRNGKMATMQVCPLCDNWWEYYKEYISLLVSEVKPDTFWIEDDFRLHNHSPLEGIGCFCEEHMALYNKKLNTAYSREEFVKRVFAPGKCTPERRAWLDVSRETMLTLAERITAAVKQANRDTDVGLMSSAPQMHCLEARDWDALYNIIGKGGNKINRIHLYYGEGSGKDTLYYLNSVSMAIRAMADDSVIVMPETENGCASSVYYRNPRFLRFTLESAIPLVLSGMTYSLYGFIGSGVREQAGYAAEVRALTPFMQAIENLNLRFSALSGVVIPTDPDACYYGEIETDYTDLEPNEYQIAAHLSGMGVPYRYSREKVFNGETVFICGTSAAAFSNEELKQLFRDNYVIIDGGGVLELKKRGLLSLINAEGAERIPWENGCCRYEKCADGETEIYGVRRLRAGCGSYTGDFVNIEYSGSVDVKTRARNQYMEVKCPALTCGNGFFVVPYCINKRLYGLFCELRRYFILKAIRDNTPVYACCDIDGISPYLYRREQDYVLVLVNGNVQSYTEIPLEVKGICFDKIYRLNRKGEAEPVDYIKNGSSVVLKQEIEYLSATALIFT